MSITLYTWADIDGPNELDLLYGSQIEVEAAFILLGQKVCVWKVRFIKAKRGSFNEPPLRMPADMWKHAIVKLMKPMNHDDVLVHLMEKKLAKSPIEIVDINPVNPPRKLRYTWSPAPPIMYSSRIKVNT